MTTDKQSISIIYDTMKTVVIDTNVILSGLSSRNGNSFKLIKMISARLFEISISVPLIFEYESVLMKYKSRTGMNIEDIADFLDYICTVGKETKIHYLWRPILKDPYDDHVLEVAVASESEYIITYNIKDFKPAQTFGIEAVSPALFLNKEGLI